MLKLILVLILLLVSLGLGAGWYIADRFLTLGIADYDAAEEQQVLAELGIADLQSEAVQIEVSEITLAGTLFRHPTPQNCGLVLLPGIGGTRTQVLPAISIFRDLGCHIIAYDPRGTGASTRVPRSFGYFEKNDNAAVIRWLAKTTAIDESSIGIWGPSFGAAVGILTLDEIPNLSFVIADSTFSTFEAVAHDTIALLSNPLVADAFTPLVSTFIEFRTGLVADEVSPLAAISRAQTPVLLIHAKEDPAMALRHSQQVYAARTNDLVQLEITDWGAGHADSALVDQDAYKRLIEDFLAQRRQIR